MIDMVASNLNNTYVVFEESSHFSMITRKYTIYQMILLNQAWMFIKTKFLIIWSNFRMKFKSDVC